MLHSHYGIDYTSKMRLKTITKLLIGAYQKDLEDKLWQQYLVVFSGMDAEHYISWQDYKKEAMKPTAPKVDKEQVIADAEKIKLFDQKGGGI